MGRRRRPVARSSVSSATSRVVSSATSRAGSLALVAALTLCAPAAVPAGRPATSQAGAVEGRVVFVGTPPALPPLVVTKDHASCGPSVPNDALAIAPGGRGVAGAVVWLEGAPVEPSPSPGVARLENRGCRFQPRVLAARVGDELEVVNADRVLHNLRGWLDRRSLFNIVQPTEGQVTRRTLKRPGAILLACDAHPHMTGHLHIFEHRHFAVTDTAGAFALPDVPAGRWRLRMWHAGWLVEGVTAGGQPVWSAPRTAEEALAVPDRGLARVEFGLR